MSEATGLPQALALRSRRRIIDDAVQGLGSSRGAHISIRGGRFRLIDAKGIEKLIDTHYIDVIVIDANDKPARVYFDQPYDPGNDVPPACWSDNGTGPSKDAMAPQAPTCAVCPMNIRGTKQTFTGKATTACESRKKVAVIIPDDTAVNVYEFQIPPGSLSNFKAYCGWLGEQASGVEGRSMDIADVVTRVAFDPNKQFVMEFKAVAYADDDRTMQLIEYIDANQLSDAAVGRLDVACDPDTVTKMLAGRPQTAALPAPAASQQLGQETEQRALPPRTNGAAPAQLNQTAPQKPPPAPRKPRTPPAQLPPASNGQAQERPAEQAREAAQTGDIPAFLRRGADAQTQTPLPNTPPRFGVGQAPPPPAEISDALNRAMSLPTRK